MKKNKLLILFFWGTIAMLLLVTSIFINRKDTEKDAQIIVYDGSENNPEIVGVQ